MVPVTYGNITGQGQPSGSSVGAAPMNAQQAFASNQRQYQDIIAGYQNQQQQQATASAQTLAGYNNVGNQVIGALKGSEAGAQLGLTNQYQQNLANTKQQMLGQGLGNTTAMEGAQNQVQGQYNQANIGLQSAYAQQIAGAIGQYGSQAVGYGAQAQAQQQALQGQQLGMMGGYLQGSQQLGNQLVGQYQGAQLQDSSNAFNAATQYNYAQQAAANNFGYQQAAANADYQMQNQYDTTGGGYAGG